MADGEGTGSVRAIKDYFGCSNAELIDFKKADPEGFQQIKEGILNGTMTYQNDTVITLPAEDRVM